jgi:hypothetical protein
VTDCTSNTFTIIIKLPYLTEITNCYVQNIPGNTNLDRAFDYFTNSKYVALSRNIPILRSDVNIKKYILGL